MSLCDGLYETWIEKNCKGYADTVLVAEFQGQPTGYISCHLLDCTDGNVGLVAVAADAKGRGLGQALVDASLRWSAERGVSWVTVVTQGRDCGAQRLYQKCGFLTRTLQLWYHRWWSIQETRAAQ